MPVKTQTKGDVAIISVSGKLLGGADTDEVHELVKSLIADGLKKQIIDLSKVDRLNSSGLGAIMACFISLKNAAGRLKIAGLSDRLRILFVMTKLDTVIEIFDTVDEAIRKFK